MTGMNFTEAVKAAVETGRALRRPGWQDGIVAYIQKPGLGKYPRFASGGDTYLATAHIAACELEGVRTVTDLLATDWKLV